MSKVIGYIDPDGNGNENGNENGNGGNNGYIINNIDDQQDNNIENNNCYNNIQHSDYYTPKHSQLQLSRGRLYQGHQSSHVIYPNQNYNNSLNTSSESLNRSINESKDIDDQLESSLTQYEDDEDEEEDIDDEDQYNHHQQHHHHHHQYPHDDEDDQHSSISNGSSIGLDENDFENIDKYFEKQQNNNNIIDENQLEINNLSISNSNNNNINNVIDIDITKTNNHIEIVNVNSNNNNNNRHTNNNHNIELISNKPIQLFSDYGDIPTITTTTSTTTSSTSTTSKNQPFLFFSSNYLNSNSTELDLSEQELNEFPLFDDKETVQNYKIIDLSFNNIGSIPIDAFRNIVKLQQLIMFNNNLTYVPSSIETLQSLTILDLSHNHLHDICRELGNLCQLRELYLSNNNLVRFPTTGNLCNLKKLVLDNNKIQTIPSECVEPLIQLQTLDLSFNSIAGLSSCISKLKNLKQLSLSHNQLSDIPSALRHLGKLHSLSLDYNQISLLPDKIVASLPRLAKLTISNNKIKQLPFAINNLESLIELNASNNMLDYLPDPLCYLGNLKKLNLNNNNLKELPTNIGFLSKLVDLQLYNNQISSLPISFLKCRSIREIGTDGNPLPSYYHLGIKAIRYHIKNPDCDFDDLTNISPTLQDHTTGVDTTLIQYQQVHQKQPNQFDLFDSGSISSSNNTITTSEYSGNTSPLADSLEMIQMPPPMQLNSGDLINNASSGNVRKPLNALSPSYPFQKLDDTPQSFLSSNPRSQTESDIKKLSSMTVVSNPTITTTRVVNLSISSSTSSCGNGSLNTSLNSSGSSNSVQLFNSSNGNSNNSIIPPIKSPPRIKYTWEIDFDELQFEGLIGQGGFSKVYHGLWKSKDVAIKQIELQSNKSLDDFRREVGILSKLKPHENLLAYYGACKHANYCYIITEYLPRGSLHDLLHREKLMKLDFKQILSFAICVALGCYHLSTYEPPIYHTDLKTKNLLVTNSLKIKIADFGLASFAKRKDAFGSSSQQSSVDKSRLAYAFYAAPEILNSKSFSEKSDVFSFGTILWELVTNKIPFDGMDPYQVKELLKSGKRLDIPDDCHHVFKTTIQDCWNQQSEDRPTFLSIYHRLENLMKSITTKKKKY